MSDLRTKMIRLAASMPKGSSQRKALLNVLAGDFTSMSMPELEKAVGKSFRGSKHNRKNMSLELSDGTLVMFSRQGRGDSAKTFINVYREGEGVGRDIPITSVEDAVSKIKKAK